MFHAYARHLISAAAVENRSPGRKLAAIAFLITCLLEGPQCQQSFPAETVAEGNFPPSVTNRLRSRRPQTSFDRVPPQGVVLLGGTGFVARKRKKKRKESRTDECRNKANKKLTIHTGTQFWAVSSACGMHHDSPPPRVKAVHVWRVAD